MPSSNETTIAEASTSGSPSTSWRRRRIRTRHQANEFQKENAPGAMRDSPVVQSIIESNSAATTTIHYKYSPNSHANVPPPLPPVIVIRHGCLLIPVAVLIWWYWTKRTVQRAVRRLVTSHAHHTTCAASGNDSNISSGGNSASPRNKMNQQQPQHASPTSVADDFTELDDYKDGYSSFHHANEDTDPFYSWDDVIHQDIDDQNADNASTQSSNNSNTLRFVRWFKSKGTRNSRARRRVQAATRHNLNRYNGAAGSVASPGGSAKSDDVVTVYDDDAVQQQQGQPLPQRNHANSNTMPMLSQSESSESDTSLLHRVCTTITGTGTQYTWQCIQNTTGHIRSGTGIGTIELCAIEVSDSDEIVRVDEGAIDSGSSPAVADPMGPPI